MKTVNRRRVLFFTMVLCCMSLVACNFWATKSVSKAYSISGKIVDSDGAPVSGVTIYFGNQGDPVITDESGKWSRDGLRRPVSVTPVKSGWTFTPQRQIVDAVSDNIDFVGYWGDPSGFFNEEVITETQLAPGVTLYSLSGSYNYQSTRYPINAYIVRVNLSYSNISARALVGERLLNPNYGHYWPRSKTSQLLTDNSALVAVNGGFFHMTQASGAITQAPTQFTVKDGMIIRSPDSAGSTSIGFTDDGRAVIGVFRWVAEVVTPYGSQTLDGINLSILNGNQLVLYNSPWDRSPGSDENFMNNVSQVTEVKLDMIDFQRASSRNEYSKLLGVVSEKQCNGSSIQISENTFVLRGTNQSSDFVNRLQHGDEVQIRWRIRLSDSTVNWHELDEVVSGYHRLVMNGNAIYGEHNRHPRTALGISAGGTRLLIVVVDGRSSVSQGIGLHILSDFLVHMGAYQGVNLDGGGSTTLAVMKGGTPQVVNRPSDGSERYVPDGLGIFID